MLTGQDDLLHECRHHRNAQYTSNTQKTYNTNAEDMKYTKYMKFKSTRIYPKAMSPIQRNVIKNMLFDIHGNP